PLSHTSLFPYTTLFRSTCRSRSKTEFVARIGVALEEADESAFWLEIIAESRMSHGRLVFELLEEINELIAIFAASRITAAESLRSEEHTSELQSLAYLV